MDSIAVLGVLARVAIQRRDQVERALASHSGVSVFDVEDSQRLGILIEKDTMEEAEGCLRRDVAPTAGILGAWPVFAHFEEAEAVEAARCTATNQLTGGVE